MPYDPERELLAASCRSKQLIVLAADALLAAVSMAGRRCEMVADELVRDRVLPGVHRARYDHAFLCVFYNVVELTRNLMVSDAPFVGSTASELAAHAILRQARAIIAERGKGWQGLAEAIDRSLPEQLEENCVHLNEELDLLEDAVIEDGEVLTLFDAAADGGDQIPSQSLLRFENWLVPFGNPPRPHITYDGRAWPGEG